MISCISQGFFLLYKAYDVLFSCEHIEQMHRYDEIFRTHLQGLEQHQSTQIAQIVKTRECMLEVEELLTRTKQLWTNKKNALKSEKQLLISQYRRIRPLSAVSDLLKQVDALTSYTEKDCEQVGEEMNKPK